MEVGGQVVIIGGRESDSALAKTLVMEGEGWREISSMVVARQFHACAEFSDKIYSIGGETVTGDLLSSVEIYDPATNEWSEGPELPEGIKTGQALNFQSSLYLLAGVGATGTNTQMFKLSGEGLGWETVPGVGVDEQMRSVFPALIVTSDLIKC